MRTSNTSNKPTIMNPPTITSNRPKKLLDAQAHIWNHIYSYHNSMALKCAIELGIPDAIHKHGNPLSLTQLIHSLTIHPSKAPSLYRLMRLLCHSNFFTLDETADGEPVFGLNTNSELLLSDHPLSQASYAISMLDPSMTVPAYDLSTWYKNDVDSAFHIAHGRSIWEHASFSGSFNDHFNKAMASDARFVASLIACSEAKCLFNGIESLVDVGGGDGTMAKEIIKANLGLKCIVLDLPHVVEDLSKGEDEKITYVGGNMFEAIPTANVALLKWILHDWSDKHCIKILEKCKEAIPNKEQGGKVIIIDIVVKNEEDTSKNYLSSQYLFDMEMMSLTIGGKERNEQEWKKLFIQAGFSDYKMSHVLGSRSIIEVYPF